MGIFADPLKRLPGISHLAVFALLLGPAALADEIAPGGASGTVAPSESLVKPSDRLVNAERLAIKFSIYPELSGEYRVSADGTISIPMVGRIKVGEMDAITLEKTLVGKVLSLSGRETFATVEVAEYRPVFVTGYVTKSGSIPWRPGMNVLQASAMAGGLGLSTGSGRQGDPGRLAKAIDELKRALAGMARLRAEEAGTEIEVPAELVTLVGRPEAEALIKEESALLLSRQKLFHNQIGSIERGQAAAGEELNGLRAQGNRLKAQLNLRLDQREKLKGLKAKGLIPEERSLDQEFRVLELEEKATNITVGIARVQATLAEMDRNTETLTRGRESEISTEKIKLMRDAAQAKIEMDAALVESSQFGQVNLLNRTPITVRYTVTRSGGSKSEVINAEESTELMPGDVLVVSTSTN